jgi:hypothetical protein
MSYKPLSVAFSIAFSYFLLLYYRKGCPISCSGANPSKRANPLTLCRSFRDYPIPLGISSISFLIPLSENLVIRDYPLPLRTASEGV